MSVYRLLLSGLLIVLASPSDAENRPEQSYLSEIAFVTLAQPMYGFTSDDGTPSGFLYDLLELLNDKTSEQSNHSILPAKRLIKEMDSDDKVCTMLLNTYEVELNYQLVVSTGIYIQAGYIGKKHVVLNNYEDLFGLRVALPLGLTFDPNFSSDPNIIKYSPPRYDNAVEMLNRDRVDVVAGAISVIAYLAYKQGITDDMLGPPLVFMSKEFHLVCNSQVSAAEIDMLRDKFNHVKALNLIEKTVKKYLPNNKYIMFK